MENTIFEIAQLAIAETQPPPSSAGSVWVLLIVCGVIAIVAFIALLSVTRQSRRAVARDVDDRLRSLKTLVSQSHYRVRKLDEQVIEQLNSLSQRGHQGYNMLKQVVGVLEKRIVDVQRLLKTERDEDLFKAHAILSSDLDNAGNGIDNLIFSESVLSLKPDQFEFAIDMMVSAVEADLKRSPEEQIEISKGFQPSRKRKFTIRGFIRAISGAG